MGELKMENGRRRFLGGALGFVAGALLMSAASVVTIFRYVFGERLSKEDQTQLQAERLRLLSQNTELDKLELERETVDQIFVSRLSDLDPAKGVYFTDFQMQQALAFADKNNLPILLSAKCTHLGCTVGSEVDVQGRVLCPCHISYFNIYTGDPSAGSPAKKPLPHLNWVVKDESGKVVASKTADGKLDGNPNLQDINKLSVYLVRGIKES